MYLSARAIEPCDLFGESPHLFVDFVQEAQLSTKSAAVDVQGFEEGARPDSHPPPCLLNKNSC